MANILIVDDEKLIANSLLRVLNRGGHNAQAFYGGLEAVHALSSNLCGTPDLAFVDLLMPEIAGAEVLAFIKAKFPDCKVVIMTAYGDSLVKQDLHSRGASLVISKPFDSIFDVLKIVDKELEGS